MTNVNGSKKQKTMCAMLSVLVVGCALMFMTSVLACPCDTVDDYHPAEYTGIQVTCGSSSTLSVEGEGTTPGGGGGGGGATMEGTAEAVCWQGYTETGSFYGSVKDSPGTQTETFVSNYLETAYSGGGCIKHGWGPWTTYTCKDLTGSSTVKNGVSVRPC